MPASQSTLSDLLYFTGFKPTDTIDPPEGWKHLRTTPVTGGHTTLTAFHHPETNTLVITSYQPDPLVYDLTAGETRRLDIAERLELNQRGEIDWKDPEADLVLSSMRDMTKELLKTYPDAPIVTTAQGDAGMVLGWASHQLDLERGAFNEAHTHTLTYDSPPYWAGTGSDPKGLNIGVEHAPRNVLNVDNFAQLNGGEILPASVQQIGVDPGVNFSHILAGSVVTHFVLTEALSRVLPDAVGKLVGKWVTDAATGTLLELGAEEVAEQAVDTLAEQFTPSDLTHMPDPALLAAAFERAGLGHVTLEDASTVLATHGHVLSQAYETELDLSSSSLIAITEALGSVFDVADRGSDPLAQSNDALGDIEFLQPAHVDATATQYEMTWEVDGQTITLKADVLKGEAQWVLPGSVTLPADPSLPLIERTSNGDLQLPLPGKTFLNVGPDGLLAEGPHSTQSIESAESSGLQQAQSVVADKPNAEPMTIHIRNGREDVEHHNENNPSPASGVDALPLPDPLTYQRVAPPSSAQIDPRGNPELAAALGRVEQALEIYQGVRTVSNGVGALSSLSPGSLVPGSLVPGATPNPGSVGASTNLNTALAAVGIAKSIAEGDPLGAAIGIISMANPVVGTVLTVLRMTGVLDSLFGGGSPAIPYEAPEAYASYQYGADGTVTISHSARDANSGDILADTLQGRLGDLAAHLGNAPSGLQLATVPLQLALDSLNTEMHAQQALIPERLPRIHFDGHNYQVSFTDASTGAEVDKLVAPADVVDVLVQAADLADAVVPEYEAQTIALGRAAGEPGYWLTAEQKHTLIEGLDALPDTPPNADLGVIALDLDRSGAIGTTQDKPVRFDGDGDDYLEATQWLGPGDGLLVVDRDGDGRITDAGELFSHHHIGLTGLQALGYWDVDHNGLIDQQDPIFAALQIWEDRNANGLSEDGELSHLSDLGVTAIAHQLGWVFTADPADTGFGAATTQLDADTLGSRIETVQYGELHHQETQGGEPDTTFYSDQLGGRAPNWEAIQQYNARLQAESESEAFIEQGVDLGAAEGALPDDRPREVRQVSQAMAQSAQNPLSDPASTLAVAGLAAQANVISEHATETAQRLQEEAEEQAIQRQTPAFLTGTASAANVSYYSLNTQADPAAYWATQAQGATYFPVQTGGAGSR